ncbi:MAG: hypothetical protein WA885_21150 [Phormidesmis sp.]
MFLNKTSDAYFQTVSRQLNLGRTFYWLYYRPRGFLKKTLQRGIISSAIDNRAQRVMEATAYQLTPLKLQPPYYDIHFLSGDRFWYQTTFCAYSMAQYSNVSVRPIVYDDGSFSVARQAEFRRIFPNAQIYSKAELDQRVEAYLPSHKFPYLRERRENYPNIRKLIDVHVGSEGWKLVLDSDMLFFKAPEALLEWLKLPQQPCHMVDTETSYGYSKSLMESLTGVSVSDRLNVGICGLNSSDIDWQMLEHWCKTLIEREGTHYYQEQALVAMLMAGQECQVVSETDYIVMPDKNEAVSPKAVLHHYVADSKPWYFRYGYKHLINAT